MQPFFVACALCIPLLAGCGDDAPRGQHPSGAEIEVLERYDPGVPEQGDQLVLDQLKQAGADMSKATDIRWFVYFPAKVDAETFAARARAGGWSLTLRQDTDETNWLCLCSRDGVPSLDAIGEMRVQLSAWAEGLDAEIDGWEAAVTR